MADPERILIVRLSAIGDVIHTLPAFECLRRRYARAAIGWVVEDFASAYLQNYPGIDSLHVIPKKRWRGHFLRHWGPEIRPFIGELRAHRYQVAIDFQGLTKSGLWARLSGASVRIGFGDAQGAELNKLFTNRKHSPPRERKHIIERNLSLLSALVPDALNDIRRPQFVFTAEEDQQASSILEGRPDVAGLNVGAGWATKRWPARHWAELAQHLSRRQAMPCLLLWGNDEEKRLAEEVLSLAAQPEEALRLCPPTSLRASGALIRQLCLYIGGDTGATHLAAAMGVPTVGIYGASDAVRNGPWWPNSVALQAHSEPCIPCWKRQCALPRQLGCLWDVKPSAVMEAIENVMRD